MNEEKETTQKLMTCLFKDSLSAGKAYNATLKFGYTNDEINVLMSEETKKIHSNKSISTAPDPTDEAINGAGVGGSLGVTTGAITGAIMAIGTLLAISGFGLVIAGPLAIGLAGASAGGIAGGLVGALINAGVPESHAKICEDEIKNGSILIGVIPHSEADRKLLETDWRNYDGILLTSK